MTPHTPPKYLFCLMKLYLELFIFLLRIVCSDISMFDDIEDVLINVDSQVCLLGDFYAHTSNVKYQIFIISAST
jgi:hypothetical protein